MGDGATLHLLANLSTDGLPTSKVKRPARQSGAMRPAARTAMVGILASGSAIMPAAIPIATYRVQLTANFDFDAAASIVPYLKALGITHLYASPS